MPTVKLTYDDYLRIPDDGLRHEVLDGIHVVSPSAGSRHQHLQLRLCARFDEHVDRRGLGTVFPDLDCVLGPNDVVRPDLIVVLAAHADRITATHVAGAPDLAIEILSPSTAANDRGAKKARCEARGVAEYWLVDADARTVEQFGLYDGSYRRLGVHAAAIQLAILPEVTLDLTMIW